MIKINDRFSIERDVDCWVLYDKRPRRVTKKVSPGTTTTKNWYPRLHDVISEVFERCPYGANSLLEVHQRMQQIKADVYRSIMGGKAGSLSETKSTPSTFRQEFISKMPLEIK